MKSKQYGYKSLIETYIATKRGYVHIDFTNYYKALWKALENSFDIHLSTINGVRNRDSRPLWFLFDATVRNYVSISTPLGSFLEVGLIMKKIDELGDEQPDIRKHVDKIEELVQLNRATHAELLLVLFNVLYDKVDRLVSSEELLAQGFDDSTEPKAGDYWNYF